MNSMESAQRAFASRYEGEDLKLKAADLQEMIGYACS
jgi:hypothetical protein